MNAHEEFVRLAFLLGVYMNRVSVGNVEQTIKEQAIGRENFQLALNHLNDGMAQHHPWIPVTSSLFGGSAAWFNPKNREARLTCRQKDTDLLLTIYVREDDDRMRVLDLHFDHEAKVAYDRSPLLHAEIHEGAVLTRVDVKSGISYRYVHEFLNELFNELTFDPASTILLNSMLHATR